MSADPTAGSQIGKFRVVRTLAAGAMGVVYQAVDPTLGRQVALKMPRPNSAHPDAVELFYREARAAARTNHPNICPIYEIGDIDGSPYFAMEFFEAGSLSNQCQRGQPWPASRAVQLVQKLALALHAAHLQGVVHRDLKPGNIMMRPGDDPVVVDFGIARLSMQQAAEPGQAERTLLTQPGAVFGTPRYMAPEQVEAQADKIGPPTDIYALGVILYELLTGQPPFDGPTAQSIMGKKLHETPTPPIDLLRTIDPWLSDICLKAMSREPRDRFPDMKAFAEALGAGDTIRANRTVKIQPEPEVELSQPVTPQRSSGLRFLVPLLLVGLLGAAGFLFLPSLLNPSDPQNPDTPPVTPVVPEEHVALTLKVSGSLQVQQGGNQAIEVALERTDPRTEVTVRLENLPPGLTAAPVKAAANQDRVLLTLSASRKAAVGTTTVTVCARHGEKLTEVPVKILVAALPRPDPATMYGGIEIGSKGVKATVLQVTLNASRQAVKVSPPLLSKTTNTTLVSLQEGRFREEAIEETAQAVQKFFQQMMEEFEVPDNHIYVMASSGVPETPNRKSLVTAIELATRSKDGPGKQLTFIDQFDEVRLSILGAMSDDFLDTSILVDIGSGSTKCGYFLPEARTATGGAVTVKRKLDGAVAFRQRVDKKLSPAEFVQSIAALRDPLITQPLIDELDRRASLVNRKNVFLSGGTIWAIVTLTHPELVEEPLVKLSLNDVETFYQQLIANPGKIPQPDLSKLEPGPVRDAAQRDVRAVLDTFNPESLLAGVEILRGVAKAFRFQQDDKVLYFPRNGYIAWIYAYVKETSARP